MPADKIDFELYVDFKLCINDRNWTGTVIFVLLFISIKNKMMLQAGNIELAAKFIKEGKLTSNEKMEKAADTMLRELVRWTKGMKVIRDG